MKIPFVMDAEQFFFFFNNVENQNFYCNSKFHDLKSIFKTKKKYDSDATNLPKFLSKIIYYI